jgi:hypothetical protein
LTDHTVGKILRIYSKKIVFLAFIINFKKNIHMKKINVLAILMAFTFMLASFGPANAQDAKKAPKPKTASKAYVAAFDDGRVLTATDIKFLNSISNGKGDKSATVNGKTYKAGQKLDATGAAALNKAKSDYRKAHPMQKATDAKPVDKSRGQENCYWYLYCDGSGTCWYIWYCD